MAYTITTRISQFNNDTIFRVVEKCGTWSGPNGGYWYILNMGDTGSSSGTLRILADNGKNFHVTLGLHGYKPWGHIVTAWESASSINRGYYTLDPTRGDTHRLKQRFDAMSKLMTSFDVTQDGYMCSYNYTVKEGRQLEVEIVVIGRGANCGPPTGIITQT